VLNTHSTTIINTRIFLSEIIVKATMIQYKDTYDVYFVSEILVLVLFEG